MYIGRNVTQYHTASKNIMGILLARIVEKFLHKLLPKKESFLGSL